MKYKNKRGFSLIELVIAIAILVILTGLLAPQFMKYLNRARQAKMIQKLDSIYSVLQTSYLDTTESHNDLITNIVTIAWGKPATTDENLMTFEYEICKNMEEILGEEEMNNICIWIAPALGGKEGYAENLQNVFVRYYPSHDEGATIVKTDAYHYYYYVKGIFSNDEKGTYGECMPVKNYNKWQ